MCPCCCKILNSAELKRRHSSRCIIVLDAQEREHSNDNKIKATAIKANKGINICFICFDCVYTLCSLSFSFKTYDSSRTSMKDISLHLNSSHLGIICTTACISAMIYNLLLECLNPTSRKTQRARKAKSISTFISVQQRSLSTHTNVQKVKWIYSPTYSVCVVLSVHNMPTVETALSN